MESAYRVRDPQRPDVGPRESISIWTYQHPGPEQDAMRAWHFVCEQCGCRMFPSFPREVKDGRRSSPRPYFRAGSSDPHRSGCTPDVATSPAAGDAAGAAPANSRRRVAPAIFVDKESAESPARSPSLRDPNSPEGSTAGPSRRRAAEGHGTSVSRTQTIRSLAACWHQDRCGVATLPLSVPGCPGRTYAEVFQRVDAAFGLSLHPADQRFILWSDNAVVQRGADHDFLIRFRSKTRKNKWLMAVVTEQLLSDTASAALCARLESAATGQACTVYLLGGFRYDPAADAFLLRPTSQRHAWGEPGVPS